MVSTLVNLPTELLEDTFSYLTRQDLQSLIFVCSVCADVGRLLLYQSIHLSSDQPHIQHTLNLISREDSIAVRISNAVLRTVPPQGDLPWIGPDFFARSVNLRSLELRGFPFARPGDQGIFNTTLQTQCPKLVRFTYRPGAVRFPESGFELAGLKCVTWQSSLGTVDLKVTPMMAASVGSLTRISFQGMVVHRTGQPYDHFLGLRFPHLAFLELGSLIQTNTQERTNIAITEFILAHGLIAHLSLGRKRGNDMFFQLRENLLTADALPHLKTFEGFPENVAVLARRQVLSLFDITSLSLYCWADVGGMFDEVDAMLDAVRTAGSTGTPQKLLGLQSLRLEFSTVRLDHKMPTNATAVTERNLMDRFAYMCPGITRWHGRLWPMHADTFGMMFEMFEHLESISLPHLSLIYIGHSPREFFLPIASKCLRLKHVIARRPLYTELEYTIYSFTRDARGELQSVAVETTRDVSMYENDF